MLSPEEQELKILEKKRKKKEYDKKYSEINKEKITKRLKEYYNSHKEKAREYGKLYREINKEKKREADKKYALSHKEQKKQYDKEHRHEYYERTKDRQTAYKEENKERIKEWYKEHRIKVKTQAMDLLGGCRCVMCGDTNLNHLTIDHTDNTGYLDKKAGFYAKKLWSALIKGTYPEKNISNLRVLCWNHNLGRRREYLDVPTEKQSYRQRYQTKLWREALDFFGGCHCGESNLKFLSISHIHNDGAERRKNGERTSSGLLQQFRKLGWPESLKEDYCLECFNCNCGRLSGG